MASDAQLSRTFHKKLYVLRAIEDALEAYADFATMDTNRRGEAWTVSFRDVDDDLEPEVLANEFANYVLAGTITRKR